MTLEFLELSCRKSIKTPSKVTLRILSGKHQSYKNGRSNLSKALKEVQNLGSLDLQMMKGELNFYRKYCDNAAELMKDTDQKAPFATEVLKKGLPIIDRKLKRLLEEIQEKARTTYKESIGEGVEETARAVCKEVQKWEIGSQEEMTQKIEEVAYLLKTKVADLPENEKIQNKIESMRHQTNLVKQYETLLFLIGLIPTMKVIPENALDQKLHYIKEDLKGELEDAKDEIISEIVSAKEEIITEIVNFKNKLNCMSFNISHIGLNYSNVILMLSTIEADVKKLNRISQQSIDSEASNSNLAKQLEDLNKILQDRLDELGKSISELPQNDKTLEILSKLNESKHSNLSDLMQTPACVATLIGFTIQIIQLCQLYKLF